MVTHNRHGALRALAARAAKQSQAEEKPAPRRQFFRHRRVDSGTTQAVQPPKLWIDAVCTNQDDHQERSGQVAIMGEMFGNALRTIVYLGELGDDASASWFRTVKEMRRIERLVSASRRPDQD